MGPFGLFGLRNREAVACRACARSRSCWARSPLRSARRWATNSSRSSALSAEDFSGGTDEVLVQSDGHAQRPRRRTRGHRGCPGLLEGRRSEYEFITGLVVDEGAEVGVETPVNSAVVEIYAEIDRARLEMTPTTSIGSIEMLVIAPRDPRTGPLEPIF